MPNSKRLSLALIFVLCLLTIGSASAQTNTPVPPTATPVPPTAVVLSVDTNQLFTSTNTWIAAFIPIFAISIGIALALVILTFLGVQITKALSNPGGTSTKMRKASSRRKN